MATIIMRYDFILFLQIALEAVENIRTVAGLTKEKHFCEMYEEKLKEPHRYY